MKRSVGKIAGISALTAVMCFALLAGCAGQELSGDFNKEEVRKATEQVITLINNQDSEGIRELSTVRMRDALTDDVLKQIYEAIGEGGQFETIEDMSMAGTTDSSSGEEFAVVVAKAKYEIKTFTFTISFTKQMKLAGLYYR
jgi:hypothetical protein